MELILFEKLETILEPKAINLFKLLSAYFQQHCVGVVVEVESESFLKEMMPFKIIVKNYVQN